MLVYFVEDDMSISYIIDKTLENMGLNRVGFQTGSSFLDAINEKLPDLILLDIMLPDISGLELLKAVRVLDKEIPILIVSALYNEMDKVVAFDEGADDYLTKPFGILELTSRISAKLRKIPNTDELSYGNVSIDLKTYKVKVNENNIVLTKKEYDILLFLMKRPKQVLTKEEIFFDVWDTTFMGQTRALDMHIKSLRKKLLDADSNVIIETEYGIGYKLGSE